MFSVGLGQLHCRTDSFLLQQTGEPILPDAPPAVSASPSPSSPARGEGLMEFGRRQVRSTEADRHGGLSPVREPRKARTPGGRPCHEARAAPAWTGAQGGREGASVLPLKVTEVYL